MKYDQAEQIKTLVSSATKIVIIQADNPDADSLGSALALESILEEAGKQTYLYCAVDAPGYLRYLDGWDRLQKDLPTSFDLSIIVDASTTTLLEKLYQSGQQAWLANKPCLVLDHHESVDNVIPFANIMINDHTRASTGELIYLLAKQLEWPLPLDAQEFIMSSILGDTQGLTNQLASAQTYKIMADMIEAGVSRPDIEERRKNYSKMPVEIFKYKAELIRKTTFAAEGRIASVSVGQTEINQYSPLYNPAPLVQNDMLQTLDVKVSIVFKHYADGKITGAIRCNPGAPIAAQLAKHLGGGGHAYASGFKVTSGQTLQQVTDSCIDMAIKLMDDIK